MTTTPRRLAVTLTGAVDAQRLGDALTLSEHAPISLALDCETLTAVARTQPELLEQLRVAFADGKLRPLLTTAHRASPALLTATELSDELRLDEELLQATLGVVLSPRGFAGIADPAALDEAGVDFVLANADHEPARVGDRLLAVPSLRWNAAALDLVVAIETITRLRDEGAELMGADELAAMLTAPWLPRADAETADVPAATRALAELTGWLLDAFALPRVPGVSAHGLGEEGWRLERFPARARLPLVRRRSLAAERRAFVAAYEMCDVLAVATRVPGTVPATLPLPNESALDYVRALGDEHGAGVPMARAELAYAELRGFGFRGAGHWRALLEALRDGFALLASRRTVDWSVAPEAAEASVDDLDDTAEASGPIVVEVMPVASAGVAGAN